MNDRWLWLLRWCCCAVPMCCGLPTLAAEFDAEKLARLRPAMQKFIDDGVVSGLVAVAGDHRGVAMTESLGQASLTTPRPMTADTVFRIASMTKPMTAITIMQLVQQGKLSVDDPVEKHLPEFKGQMLVAERDQRLMVLKKPARPVTIRDLLTHTSGLIGAYPEGLGPVYAQRHLSLAETTFVAAQRPLEFEPGTKWSYCNPGIDVLGRVVEVLSGQTFEEYLQQHLFDPVQMVDTKCYETPSLTPRLAEVCKVHDGKLKGVPAWIGHPAHGRHAMPAGGLLSTAGDLARLCQALLDINNGSTGILKTETLAEMTKTQTGDLTTGFVDGMSFGYGFAVVKTPVGVTANLSPGTYGHGGAFGTQYWMDPERDLFFVLLIQRDGLPNGDGSDLRKMLQQVVVEALRPVAK